MFTNLNKCLFFVICNFTLIIQYVENYKLNSHFYKAYGINYYKLAHMLG